MSWFSMSLRVPKYTNLQLVNKIWNSILKTLPDTNLFDVSLEIDTGIGAGTVKRSDDFDQGFQDLEGLGRNLVEGIGYGGNYNRYQNGGVRMEYAGRLVVS